MFTQLERDWLLFVCRTKKSATETQLLDDNWTDEAKTTLRLEVDVISSIIEKVTSLPMAEQGNTFVTCNSSLKSGGRAERM